MAWDSKYSAFGVIKIQGDKVCLYSSRGNYATISTGKQITNAVWAGNILNVTLSDGKVRRYSSRDNYSSI